MSVFKSIKWRRKSDVEQTDEDYCTISVRVVIEEDDDKFCATAPALPGLIIDGDTVEQVRGRVKDGIIVYLMTLAKYGDSLPVGPDLTIELHKKEDFGFSRFGNPEPFSDPDDWTTMPWPTRELLGAN